MSYQEANAATVVSQTDDELPHMIVNSTIKRADFGLDEKMAKSASATTVPGWGLWLWNEVQKSSPGKDVKVAMTAIRAKREVLYLDTYFRSWNDAVVFDNRMSRITVEDDGIKYVPAT